MVMTKCKKDDYCNVRTTSASSTCRFQLIKCNVCLIVLSSSYLVGVVSAFTLPPNRLDLDEYQPMASRTHVPSKSGQRVFEK